jgi:thiol-disulfide isomerase/thioredoxin
VGAQGRLGVEDELVDVATGETFTIGDFAGRPVLVESFAVWCPTCTAQQREIGRLREQEGDAVVHVSLDTDPNETNANIEAHLELNGFDWRYAVSPVLLTQALIDDYGLSIVNAPGAPIVLICPDQSSRLLRRGVKTAADLAGEIAAGCGQ